MTEWKSDDVERVLPALRRYARALTRDEEAAADLVQEALVRAYERASTFRPDRSLKSWLLSIVHNRFVDDERRQKLERKRDAALARIGADTTLAGSPEQSAYLREVAMRFAALPDEQRAVLHLVAVEGLTYQEASQTLVVPIGTIMSRLSRARAALRHGAAGESDRGPLRIVRGTDAP